MNDKDFDEYDAKREAEKIAHTRAQFEEQRAKRGAPEDGQLIDGQRRYELIAVFQHAAISMHRRAQKNEGAARRLDRIRTAMKAEIDYHVRRATTLDLKLQCERLRARKLERELEAAYAALDAEKARKDSFFGRIFG